MKKTYSTLASALRAVKNWKKKHKLDPWLTIDFEGGRFVVLFDK